MATPSYTHVIDRDDIEVIYECPNPLGISACLGSTTLILPLEGFERYANGTGEPVQLAFPEYAWNADIRETIKTGWCQKCIDDMYGGLPKE